MRINLLYPLHIYRLKVLFDIYLAVLQNLLRTCNILPNPETTLAFLTPQSPTCITQPTPRHILFIPLYKYIPLHCLFHLHHLLYSTLFYYSAIQTKCIPSVYSPC